MSSYVFGAALKSYQAGQLAEAERLCHQILASEPEDADAWNLLGVVIFLTGRKELALQHLHQAVRLKPDFADAYNNLGNVLRDLNRSTEAIVMYERCLQVAPNHAESLDNLGRTLRETRQSAAAEVIYRRLLLLRPNFDDAHYRLGLALEDQGNYAAAADSYRRALAIRADHIDALNHLGIAQLALGRPAEAAEAFESVIKLKPDFSVGYCNLGSALWALGRFDEALAACTKALEIEPSNSQALNNLGGVLLDLGQNAEAIDTFRKALEIESNHQDARRNLAAALMSEGQLDAALAELEQSFIAEPNNADAHKNKALTCLLGGDYRRGWAEYEWRWQTKEFTPKKFPVPRWSGEDPAGKTILIYAEQGLGDSLHFVRYLSIVEQRGGRVVFECKPTMRRLLQSARGIDELVALGEPLPPFDLHAPLLSLPHLLNLPDPQDSLSPPYLFAEPDLVAHWKSELESVSGFKVGINWQGRPTNKRDRFRSIPLAHFLGLAELPGVRLISLQKGYGSEQLPDASADGAVLDLGSRLDETTGAFMDTAAVLHNLDLLITCDTALAHLAGALGRPVWVALCSMPDWRWLLRGERTPWYPSMKLFRQTTLGDWSSVFAQIGSELRSMVRAEPLPAVRS